MHHQKRRLMMIALLLSVVAVLGVVLFGSVKPNGAFSLAAPKPKAKPTLPDGISQDISGTLQTVSATTLLEKPRYTGQDALGRTWTVEAEAALQGGNAVSGTYILQQVGARWDDPSQTLPLTLTAQEGRYNPSSTLVDLNGTVQAQGRGVAITAPAMRADLTNRTLTATGGVHVTFSPQQGR